ncbi:hypothetical protein HPP92_015901 [Vanilla planifolia]|uniref:Uncharacterized protein n=1 Tax=Vanilla planifolia TaxID=51239 RepID=A0A835USU6_VANPL|nr:hypothetical protein HPP92_016491 [Vanilla planifolia]KAG0471355.1 hypothetical protein HPP92_015901 [Vanilla planifolia]
MQTPNEEEGQIRISTANHSINHFFSFFSLPQEFSRGIGHSRKKIRFFPGNVEACEGEDELSDDYSQPGREEEEPNMEQLARVFGLQPRTDCVWFKQEGEMEDEATEKTTTAQEGS